MNKNTLIVTSIAFALIGCASTTTKPQLTGYERVVAPKPGPDSKTDLTAVSKGGYKSIGLDPTKGDYLALDVPASAGDSQKWQAQTHVSDDFRYTFNRTSERSDFGDGKWYNFYHNSWDGPGATYWKHDHVGVQNNNLEFYLSRNPSTEKQGKPGVNAGCITSNTQVQYPVFVEASVSLADISLATAVWLLSPDDTQEIDILEAYPGKDNNNGHFSQYIHLSHHSFIRDPFTDYQPRDTNSWWLGDREGHASWGDYTWNNGERQYIQIGLNWVNPFHFEYYINGELVRVVYNNAFATKMFNRGEWTWTYSYPKVNGNKKLSDDGSGYQAVDIYKKEQGDFDFALLKQASERSPASVIDPYNYQDGNGFDKPMDIIINNELQSWWTSDPTDKELADTSGRTTMLVDWIRVFKPVAN